MIRAVGLSLLAGTGIAMAQPPASYTGREDVKAFIGELVERHGFVRKELTHLFARAKRQDGVLKAIQAPPSGNRSWEEYRAGFLSEERVQAGLAFWERNRSALERARTDYGVPEEVVVAIMGVETFYGRRMGRWRVIDALTTLAFDYPPRAPFFRAELESFLVFSRDRQIDVLSVHGSYAGAIGMPQFMPGSYLRYAVDYDGDGIPDLTGNATDAIGSVANFLLMHGWRPGETVLLDAVLEDDRQRPYIDDGLLPRHSLADLRQDGVGVRGEAPVDARVVLVELRTPQRPSDFRLGLQNFWVITRYNRSAFYASAVADLARALRNARQH